VGARVSNQLVVAMYGFLFDEAESVAVAACAPCLNHQFGQSNVSGVCVNFYDYLRYVRGPLPFREDSAKLVGGVVGGARAVVLRDDRLRQAFLGVARTGGLQGLLKFGERLGFAASVTPT